MPPNPTNNNQFDPSSIDTDKNFKHNDAINVQDVVVRRDEMTRLNDPDCKHKNIVKDSETIGEFQAWKCTDCNRGRFLPKSVTKIT